MTFGLHFKGSKFILWRKLMLVFVGTQLVCKTLHSNPFYRIKERVSKPSSTGPSGGGGQLGKRWLAMHKLRVDQFGHTLPWCTSTLWGWDEALYLRCQQDSFYNILSNLDLSCLVKFAWPPKDVTNSPPSACPSNFELRITSRTMCVLLLLTARKVYFLLEQPSSSRLLLHPELIHLQEVLKQFAGMNFFTRLLDT